MLSKGEGMQFGEKLRALRKDAGMTQAEMAEKLMVSRQAVSKWETNLSVPDIDNVLAICKLFHVSSDDLMREENTVQKATLKPHSKKKVELWKKSAIVLLLLLLLLLVGEKIHIPAVATLYAFLGIIGWGLYCAIRLFLRLVSKFGEEEEKIG